MSKAIGFYWVKWLGKAEWEPAIWEPAEWDGEHWWLLGHLRPVRDETDIITVGAPIEKPEFMGA